MMLYLVRHADPDYEAGTITAHGHREAAALAERLAALRPDLRPSRLYSSPLGRAVHTAEYTARKLRMELHIEPWAQELGDLRIEQGPPYGETMIWDLHGETIHTSGSFATTADWLRRPPFDDPGVIAAIEAVGRSSDAFFARHGYERNGVSYRITGERDQRITVFCHGGLGLTWLSHLLGVPVPLVWAGFYLWPSSVTTILFDERTPGVAVPRCIGLGDVSHLVVAGLEPRPRGVKANVT
jgi:broad specificity phosphatase PhoE